MKEIIGEKYFTTLSVGDLFRNAHTEYLKKEKQSDIYKYIIKNYRGYLSPDELIDALINRNTKTVCPTELALILIKRAIDSIGHKTIFIDGFPRTEDQISYSLYMRDLIGYREDPDYFMYINIPVSLIDLRIKDRRNCPKCGNSKNLKTNPSSICVINKKSGELEMFCDNPSCSKELLKSKEGDHLGIKNIEKRIETDLKLVQMTQKLYGIPKIEVYNSIPVKNYKDYLNEFEVTKEYYFETINKELVRKEKDLVFTENGISYVSLLPSANVIQIIRQINHYVQ